MRWWGIPLAHENLSQTDLDDCVFGPEDITLYNDPQWLKNGYRRDATQCTRVSTLIHMLSKGRQLPRDLLEKGLVGQYFDTAFGPRWPTKHELCALMGFHRGHCESMSNGEARERYGNAVIPAMIVVALAPILQFFQRASVGGEGHLFDFDQLLLNLGRRVTMTPQEAPATVLDSTEPTPLVGTEFPSDDDLRLLDLGA